MNNSLNPDLSQSDFAFIFGFAQSKRVLMECNVIAVIHVFAISRKWTLVSEESTARRR